MTADGEVHRIKESRSYTSLLVTTSQDFESILRGNVHLYYVRLLHGWSLSRIPSDCTGSFPEMDVTASENQQAYAGAGKQFKVKVSRRSLVRIATLNL